MYSYIITLILVAVESNTPACEFCDFCHQFLFVISETTSFLHRMSWNKHAINNNKSKAGTHGKRYNAIYGPTATICIPPHQIKPHMNLASIGLLFYANAQSENNVLLSWLRWVLHLTQLVCMASKGW